MLEAVLMWLCVPCCTCRLHPGVRGAAGAEEASGRGEPAGDVA